MARKLLVYAAEHGLTPRGDAAPCVFGGGSLQYKDKSKSITHVVLLFF